MKTIFFEDIDSTQEEAKRLLQAENAPLTVPFAIVAQSQSAGRGRRGRAWISAKGNYYASIIVKAPKNPQNAPHYSFIAAAALLRLLQDCHIAGLAFKWPNDILINQKKAAGILVESENSHLIIGIGVNLTSAPRPNDLTPKAVEAGELPLQMSAKNFHEAYIKAFFESEKIYHAYGLSAILSQFSDKLWARAALFDNQQNEQLVQIKKIADDGALIIHVNGSEQRVYSGDFWNENPHV